MPRLYFWNDIQALVETPTIEDWTRPLAGAADALEDVLRHSPRVPDGLLRDALALRDPRFLAAVLGNKRLVDDPRTLDRILELVLAGDIEPFAELLLRESAILGHAGVRERLTETGHPKVLKEACGAPWSWKLRRKAVAAGGGHVDRLLNAAQQALEAKKPELMLVAEQLNALLAFHDHTKGLERLARVDAERLRPEVADVLRAVLEAGDGEILRAAAERAEGTEGLLTELYDEKTPGDHRRSLEWREPLDWTALTVAAREKPFGKKAAAAVTAHPGCPRDLRDLLYVKHAVVVAEHTAHPDADLVKVACPRRSRPKAVRTLVRRGLGQGIGAAALATEAAPAVAVLEMMRASPEEEGPARREWEQFAGRLAVLVEQHLGADAGAWRSARALLPDFPGTIPELLSEAAAGPATGPWPEAADYPESSAPSSLTGARAAFVTLLDAAGEGVHGALTPHLDVRTLHDLYRFCAWRPAWTEQALASAPGGAVSPVWILAGRPGLAAQDIERLMSVADPEVLTRLFWHEGGTDDQRVRILSTESERLREMAPPAGLSADWRLADLYACTDLELFRRILNSVYVLGRLPQLRMFLHVWRTWGAEEVAAMLDTTPVTYSPYDGTRREIRELLGRADQQEVLAKLEAETAGISTAEAQIAMWRNRRDRAAMMKETYAWHWPELLAEHHREPFHHDVIGLLRRVPDCPEELRREADTVLLSWECKVHGRLMAGVPAEKVLAEFEVDANFQWLATAVAKGHLTWEQALEHGHPADMVLRRIAQSGRSNGGYDALTALVRDTLKDNPDAWLLAVSMLPGFTGSVAELLRTAGVAMG
ncbi:hypothetical protein ABGB18_08030 [Nonomuraea sp. B12E4]|uniref:hypothetical protein n=1 Tax=Nonomuraea sp. B12E4 TaxID=3153564 RepID=UPI00325E1284